MNIEQLKLILETVNNAGQGAYVIGLLWMIKGYFVALISWVCGLLVLKLIVKGVRETVASAVFPNEIRRVAGSRNPYGNFRSSERDRIVQLVKMGLEYEEQQKTKKESE